ncbi:MAG: ABC transporter ATP-binding protein [Chloroflexi bacterium]|jgi:branched-chain amino acid transport system ATP-binding protein|nr:ABC transporter ATP-binding protein [Chloroflexota bacterium]
MTARETIIETQNLSKHFGGLAAVDDVSIKIETGTLHAIIGPNGAGKTTFFNLLSGNLKPTTGKVFYKGQDITGKPIYRMIHMGIGRSFQITNIFPNLTVHENIRLASQAMEDKNFRFLMDTTKMQTVEERTAIVIEKVGLSRQADIPARVLPHGDQRKLELGIILAPDPELLLLDEPTAGMATDQVPELITLIQEVQQSDDKTVILVEHNMNVVMKVSDRITVMHQGKILAEGTPAEIAANHEVQTAYLGGLYDLNT